MSTLRILKAAYEALRAHCEAAYPHEGCGVLLGTSTAEGWVIASAVPATNAIPDLPGNRYAIAPRELVAIERRARACGLCIAGFYHSHPDHPPHWSHADLAGAHWLHCAYLITRVDSGTAAETCASLLGGTREEDKEFLPAAIEIVDAQ